MFKKERVYLDWAAATPLSTTAYKAMEPWLKTHFGNPSAIHTEGSTARQALESARQSVATTLGVRANEVFFTGSGTEANNLAILGYVRNLIETGAELSNIEIITTGIEHPSVTNVLKNLSEQGVVIHEVSLTEEGLVDLEHVPQLINENTKLISLSYVNSEIGAIQPIKRLTRLVRKFNQAHNTKIKVHLDAAQAPLWLSCDVHQLGVDMVTLDAGKYCGPKGTGILVKLSATEIQGVILGGGQEAGLRGGTENVAGIVGAASALQVAQGDWLVHSQKVAEVRDEAISLLLTNIPSAILNGPVGENRVANNINVSLPGLDTEYVTIWLDEQGFAVSTKSACSGAGGGESKVVKEISGDAARASSTLRITLGPTTTNKDLERLTKKINEHLKLMSKLTQK